MEIGLEQDKIKLNYRKLLMSSCCHVPKREIHSHTFFIVAKYQYCRWYRVPEREGEHVKETPDYMMEGEESNESRYAHEL